MLASHRQHQKSDIKIEVTHERNEPILVEVNPSEGNKPEIVIQIKELNGILTMHFVFIQRFFDSQKFAGGFVNLSSK